MKGTHHRVLIRLRIPVPEEMTYEARFVLVKRDVLINGGNPKRVRQVPNAVARQFLQISGQFCQAW